MTSWGTWLTAGKHPNHQVFHLRVRVAATITASARRQGTKREATEGCFATLSAPIGAQTFFVLSLWKLHLGLGFPLRGFQTTLRVKATQVTGMSWSRYCCKKVTFKWLSHPLPSLSSNAGTFFCIKVTFQWSHPMQMLQKALRRPQSLCWQWMGMRGGSFFFQDQTFSFLIFFYSEELGVPGWVGVYHARWERARAVRRHWRVHCKLLSGQNYLSQQNYLSWQNYLQCTMKNFSPEKMLFSAIRFNFRTLGSKMPLLHIVAKTPLAPIGQRAIFKSSANFICQ